jgi:ADP-heptose:LPS heptosyltransferase
MALTAWFRERAITAGCRALDFAWRPWNRPPRQAAPPRRILVLRPCCLGDVLLTTPLLAALAGAYPDAEIVYAVGQHSAAALAQNPHVDRLLPLPDRPTRADWDTIARRLRRERFDLAVLPLRTPLAPLAARRAGIPRRVGLDSAGRGFALTDRVPVQGVRHETDLALDLARALGVEPAQRRLYYGPSADAQMRVLSLLVEHDARRPYFIVHPGGGVNPGVTMDAKRWAPERFGQVADALVARHGGTAILVGAPNEQPVVAAARAAMSQAAVDLGGKLSLDELGALCQHAALYLGNDSGTTHLAEAAGAPTVVVFGPTDPAQYGPVDGIGEAIWDADACGPYVQRGDLTRAAQNDTRCIDAITVEQVLAATERVLARAAG